MRKKFLTDIVGEDYRNWVRGDIAFLSTPTGSGKTTFALGVYAPHVIAQGGKVLILEPRTILVEQIKNQCRRVFADNVERYEDMVKGITVWSYQTLEEKLQGGIGIADFDAIIADEIHYFLSDSTFNAGTALSYFYLVQQTVRRRAVLILMSATIQKIREFFLQDAPHSLGIQTFGTTGKVIFSGNTAYDYGKKADYRNLKVRYLQDDNQMIEISSAHPKKILWFCSSKKRGEEILAKLQDRGEKVGMVTADNKTDEAALIVNSLVRKGKFSEKILLATSVLDVGVSIVDQELDTVVLDAYDRETFIQMLGRIRMAEESQQLKVFIFARTAQNYRNMLDRQIIPQLDDIQEITRKQEEFKPAEIVRLLLSQPFVPSVYTEQAEILSSRLTVVRLNELYLSYLDFEEGLQTDPDYAIKKQLEWLGLQDTFSVENYVNVEVKEIKKDKLYQIIKRKGGEAMAGGVSKNEIAQFLEEIKPAICNLDLDYVRSNTTLSVNKFNQVCEKEGLPFFIAQKEVDKKQEYQLILKKDVA